MHFKHLIGLLFCIGMMSLDAWSSDSFSYSGRLVGASGAPVSGPVNLRFNLAYTSNPSVVLCSDEALNVSLSHGVFHVKLDFNCGANSLKNVLAAIPLGSSVAIQTVDITNTPHKSYSYQAMHSVPFSVLAEKAKDLGPLNATTVGEVLTWDGSKWKAAPPAGGSGALTINAHEGLSITGTSNIGIASGGVTASKLDSMGATDVGQVLKWDGASWTAGFDADNGVAASRIRKFAFNDDPLLNPAPSCSDQQVLRYILATDSLECFTLMTNDLDETKDKLAPSQKAVAEALKLKQDIIESSLKLTRSGSTSVTLEAPASGGNISYTLPLMGSDGQVLKLGASGVLEWGDIGVTNSQIADGEIDQTKISGLVSELTTIKTSIGNLNTSNIPEHPDYLYFTEPRVLETKLGGINTSALPGVVDEDDSIFSALEKIIANQNKFLEKSGGSLSGNLDMGGNLITGLGAPSDDGDAATKEYVDAQSFWEKVPDPDDDIYRELGNVGIGTSTPGGKLDVKLGTDSDFFRIQRSSATGRAQIILADETAAEQWRVGMTASGQSLFAYFDGTSNKLVMERNGHSYFESGNLGIGTTIPNAKLTVDGVLSLKEGAAPTLTADYGKLYVGTDSKLYFMNDLGVATVLGSSDGGTPGDNTITSDKISDGSIGDADINASAGIAATKIGAGTVDNTELGYLDGVTGPIQNQLNDIKQVPAAIASETTKYLRGDNSWQTLSTLVVSEDPSNMYFTEERVRDTKLTDYSVLLSVPLDAGDSILTALGKLEAQITSNDTDIAALNAKGQWSKSGASDIYYSSGNVGIGTTSPASLLNLSKVDATSYDPASATWQQDTMPTLKVHNPANSNLVGSQIILNNRTLTSEKSVRLLGLSTDDGSAFAVVTGARGSENERFRVDAKGNVGIGTTSINVTGSTPTARVLSIAGDGTSTVSNGRIELINPIASGSMTTATDAGRIMWVIPNNGSTGSDTLIGQMMATLDGVGGVNGFGGKLEFKTKNDNNSSTVTRMVIDSSGRVGIGTPTPSEKLEVVGNIKATEFLYTSDERLKHDIKTLSKAIDKVLKLRGVEFKWNKNDQKTMGFIAQEVEKVLPELVKTDEYSDLKAVQYGNLVALLVEALKEENQARITAERKISSVVDEMKVEMKKLDEENKELKKRLELIEKYINEKR